MNHSNHPGTPSVDPLQQPWPQLEAASAYALYQQWRHRCPEFSSTRAPVASQTVTGVMDILEQVDVFVFDAFGVLNTGTQAIAGAADTVAKLREQGKQVVVLSNGASTDRSGNLKKLQKMGFDFSRDELMSSRDVCEQCLSSYPSDWRWGVAGRDEFEPAQFSVDSVLLADDPSVYERVDAFIFLSTAHWSADRQGLLEASLTKRKRTLVVANPDIVAPFPDGFSIEPGYFGHRLADQLKLACDNLDADEMPAKVDSAEKPVVRFFGKPFVDVYAHMTAKLASLGYTDLSRICMVGDTLHTDILGGHAAGWRTALVTDYGLFASLDAGECIADCGIVPDWIMPAIG